MPHDFPIDPANLQERTMPKPVSPERRRELFNEIMSLPVRRLQPYFAGACIGEFEPNFTPDQLQQILRRCRPDAVEALRKRIQDKGTPEMLARVDAALAVIAAEPRPG